MLYIKLFLKESKHRLGLLLISAIAFLIMFHFNDYTIGSMEYIYMLFSLVICAAILSEDEMDFLIIGKIQLSKVFVIRFLSSFFTVTIFPIIWILLFTRERRPLKAVFAFLVTVLIIAAIGAFFRVVLKSTLAAMIFSSIVFTLLLFASELGAFSPFGSMSIAAMETFYLNRFIWIGVSIILIGCSFCILKFKDQFNVLTRKAKK